MRNYDVNLKKLDELCDLLDQEGVEGNVIRHVGNDWKQEPYAAIWKGDFKDGMYLADSEIPFKVYWWPLSERYSLRVYNDDYNEKIRKICQPERGQFNLYLFKTPEGLVDIIQASFSHKENNMKKEFTLETVLFGKLKEKGIYYKFDNGVYNPRNIIIMTNPITTKMNYNICRVKSIPDPSDLRSYWVNWFGVPAEILVDLKIDRTTYYDWSEELIEDILKIEKKLVSVMGWKPIEMKWEIVVPTIRIVDVIFNDPATIVFWTDGTKTVVQAVNEPFDPEKGLAMAISKKVLGNKHDYYELFKKYVGRYEKKQKKATR